MSDNIPKKHKITEYWKDKAIDKQTFKVVEYKGQPNVIPVVKSTMYSCCWACNIHSYDEYENYFTFKQTWDWASYLERCHILPKMLGGGDELHIAVKWGARSAPSVHLYRLTGALFIS